MSEKIIQITSEFYGKLINIYLPAYFSWLTEKLSGVEPFAMLSISIVLIFALVTYVWFRNRNV
ncbi:MAG TPA: hypothetical protein P5232_03960 [Candidatus Moranbacteria bacterium]|nr:hypothetical protein [Candidatus Moranbacteria bacterium]